MTPLQCLRGTVLQRCSQRIAQQHLCDTFAHRTKRTIEERMGEDPAFYQKFSELLAQAIFAFRQQRLSDAAYLSKVTEIAAKVNNRTGDDIPPQLEHHDVAKAFYGCSLRYLAN